MRPINQQKTALLIALLAAGSLLCAAAGKGGVFAKDNLVAWCIVPFDANKRGPVERAEMLKRLGITMLAYDWREEHVPTFDQELDELAKRGIKLQSFWLSSGLEPERDKRVGIVLDFLKRRQVRTEIWYFVATPKDFGSLPEEKKIEAVARAVGYVAGEARKFGSKVGFYNHGGWSGEPENQIAVIKKLKMDNVGLVYNFHHGREHMDRFPEFFPKMVPYLLAVNLNAMKKGAPIAVPIGEGERDLEFLKIIKNSKYRGPIGVLNHRTDVNAEVGLKQYMDGLKGLLRQMGDKAALKTY